MFKFIYVCIPLILKGIFLNFIFVALCKIVSAANIKKLYRKVLTFGFILSVLSIIMISAEELELFKAFVLPQLQENGFLNVFVAIAIFYVTFLIIYVANIYILELWWKIELKLKR